MNLAIEDIEQFEAQGAKRAENWFVQSAKNLATGVSGDIFYPYSFMNMYDPPIVGFEALYSNSSVKIQKALRRGVARIGALSMAHCPDWPNATDENRYRLFELFTGLTTQLLCFESTAVLGEIGCEENDGWQQEDLRDEVFAACTRCLGNLAIKHSESTFWDPKFALSIESAIIKLVRNGRFRNEFSPFIVTALTSLFPQKIYEYLDLLGPNINEMHRTDPTQRAMAHLTAQRIFSVAPSAFIRQFEKLDFRNPSSKDHWLISALFSEQGPLEFQRDRRDTTKPKLTLKGKNEKVIRIRHPDFAFYNPSFRSRLPKPKDDRKKFSTNLLRDASDAIYRYFSSSKAGSYTDDNSERQVDVHRSLQ